MGVLDSLQPVEVFKFFEEICAIPHGSYNEKGISDYCVRFAEERGLKYYQDELNNVIIVKEAAEGYESSPTIIIQGHLDMVCEKTADSDFDFTKDGIRLMLDNGYVTADGTTLGGDDGIAIAYALAILDSDTIEHPRLEAVFTVSEETGMEGASGIDLSMLQGRMLLNIDSEEEGCLLTSCAGGCHMECSADFTTEAISESWNIYRADIAGLTGGHSGVEIHKGRANANVVMADFLHLLDLSGTDYRIIEMHGGRKDNAIPVDSVVTFAISGAVTDFENSDMVKGFEKMTRDAYKDTDSSLSFRVTAVNTKPDSKVMLDYNSSSAVSKLLYEMPNGVQNMSADIPGMVETSLNLGIVSIDNGKFRLSSLLRSSKGSSLDSLIDKIRCICDSYGVGTEVSARYPAWEYIADSPLRNTMIAIYNKLYHNGPRIESIHAGVECGILAAKIPGLDCVSFGPDIIDIHTPNERLDIASVQRTWEYIKEILKAFK